MRGSARPAFGLVFCLALAAAAAPTSWADEGGGGGAAGEPREWTVWGTVVAAGADSLTVQPTPAARRPMRRAARRGEAVKPPPPPLPAAKPEAPPAQQVIPVSKDRTEVAFAEVLRELPMADGTTLRTFIDPVRATLADLKAGLPVQVTVRDGAATRVLIAWSEPAVLVRVEAGSITYRPEPPPDGAKPGEAVERKVTVGGETTKVRFEVITGEGRVPGGFRQDYEYRPGKLADLKAGDAVVVCAKDGAAVKVTILPRPVEPGAGQ